MSEILMEVDDAIRAQQMKALWDKYGQWIIGIVVGVVIATTVGVIWRNVLDSKLTAQTNELLAILQNEAEKSDTEKKLSALHDESNFPLKSVVDLYRAQKLEQAKDLKATQAAYKEMMTQRRLPEIIQNLARVHYVRLGILQDQKADELLDVIQPVASKDTAPFHASALEMKGLLLQQQGKNKEANEIFTKLSTDSTIPGTMRQRAKALVSYETSANAK
jgi:hypothetical protein